MATFGSKSQHMQSNTEKFVWGAATRTDALGSNQLWGWSPAKDLLEPLPETTGDISILLASPGDLRSVLRTISGRRSHDRKMGPITLYVYERTPEQLARHLLLLRIAFDWELPLRQRCAAWLEVYGNALVQGRTETYIGRLAEELVDFVGGDDESPLADVVDLSRLKFKERDLLSAAFVSWKPTQSFDINDLWERRLRHQLGNRYDAKGGVFDWDYRYGLIATGGDADLVHLKQYKRWRETGVAFEFGDCTYDAPNRTLELRRRFIEKQGVNRGLRREVKGFWGDMSVGPYCGLGIDVRDRQQNAGLFEIHDRGHATERRRHNATEIAMFNLLADLYATEKGEQYVLDRKNDVFSGLGSYLRKDRDALEQAETIVESLDGITIIPLCGNLEKELHKVPPLDVVDLSVMSVDKIKLLQGKLKPGARIYAETGQFLVPLKKEEKATFVERVKELAAGFTPAKCEVAATLAFTN